MVRWEIVEWVKADVKDPDLVEHAWTTGGFPSNT